MSETAIPIAEAAADFLRVLELVETRGEPATLTRDGKAVARLIPLSRPATTCEELADRWEKLAKLPLEETEAFATDLEQARATVPPVKPAWD